MTYYYWFFIALIAFPITIIVQYLSEKSWRSILQNIKHKTILSFGVALVGAIYWFPFISKTGFTSVRTEYFYYAHSNLGAIWNKSLEGTLILAGIFFAGYFWYRWKNARIAVYYGGALILILLDRAFNTGNQSTQTRKILEYTFALTLPPLIMGFEMIWENIGNNKKIHQGLIAVIIIVAVIFGNNHIEDTRSNLYKNGVNTRYPERAIADFKNADCFNAVFLTNKYIESCYLPYFVFTPVTNVTAHPAGKFNKRKEFLRSISGLLQPQLLSYTMTYNMYDKIDYIYLPFNRTTGCYELMINTVPFNAPLYTDTIRFTSDIFSDSLYFSKIDNNGMMKINRPERSLQIDSIIQKDYPDIARQMQ